MAANAFFSVYQSHVKWRFISGKRNLKIEENLVVSEYTICCHVAAYQNSM